MAKNVDDFLNWVEGGALNPKPLVSATTGEPEVCEVCKKQIMVVLGEPVLADHADCYYDALGDMVEQHGGIGLPGGYRRVGRIGA